MCYDVFTRCASYFEAFYYSYMNSFYGKMEVDFMAQWQPSIFTPDKAADQRRTAAYLSAKTISQSLNRTFLSSLFEQIFNSPSEHYPFTMHLMGQTIQTPVCWRLQPSAVRFSLDIAMTVPNWRYPWTSFWNWLHSWWYPGTDYIWDSSWYSQAMVQKCRALSEFRRIYWENVTVSRENCPAKCLFKHIAGQFLKLKCFANIFIEFHCASAAVI